MRFPVPGNQKKILEIEAKKVLCSDVYIKESEFVSATTLIQDADINRTDVAAFSPLNSKIMGFFNLTYPNGNQTFIVRQPCVVTWDHRGSSVLNVKLDYSLDDFNTSYLITGSTIPRRLAKPSRAPGLNGT